MKRAAAPGASMPALLPRSPPPQLYPGLFHEGPLLFLDAASARVACKHAVHTVCTRLQSIACRTRPPRATRRSLTRSHKAAALDASPCLAVRTAYRTHLLLGPPSHHLPPSPLRTLTVQNTIPPEQAQACHRCCRAHTPATRPSSMPRANAHTTLAHPRTCHARRHIHAHVGIHTSGMPLRSPLHPACVRMNAKLQPASQSDAPIASKPCYSRFAVYILPLLALAHAYAYGAAAAAASGRSGNHMRIVPSSLPLA